MILAGSPPNGHRPDTERAPTEHREATNGRRAPTGHAPGTHRASAADLLDPADLADWQADPDRRTIGERAAADRSWVFGHVVVDEAQELSPMVWRLPVRRCPTRSFTVVGDMAQTGAPAGPRSWSQALDPWFGPRWRLEQLTVNYRTPAEVMAASAPVVAAVDAGIRPARAVRSGADAPVREQVDEAGLTAGVIAVASRELRLLGDGRADSGPGDTGLGDTGLGDTGPGDVGLGDSEPGDAGRVAVIVPQARWTELGEALAARLGASWGEDPELERELVVLTVAQAKGLEFDSVVIVDPASVLAGADHGLNDLYVAMTRASGRLTVVHLPPVPPVLAHLTPTRSGGLSA